MNSHVNKNLTCPYIRLFYHSSQFSSLLFFPFPFYDFRLRAVGKGNAVGTKKSRSRDRSGRGIPLPEVNAELQANIDVC